MCGIHLIWGKGANEENIDSLIEASVHRGPEHKASLSPWPELWIGVNRLRISDPRPQADQPIWSPDGNSFLIWNGEIYNHKELRSLLKTMGQDFETESDSEVLLHWLRSFGEKGMDKLKGMFSLILVDIASRNVLVARDAEGEKPMYYRQSPDTLIISSTARGIAGLAESSIDLNSIENYSYLRFPRRGHTFFSGVREWKPDRYSMISHHNTFRFDELPKLKSDGKSESLEDFEEILETSITRQFETQVPAGMLMSGGADSALLYAAWNRLSGKVMPHYTIEVEKKYQNKYQDAHWARELVKKYPTEQNFIKVDQKVFLDRWDEYVAGLDQPIGDSAGFLLWLIGSKAKEDGIKVMISGAGADELWGGYRRHDAFDHFLKRKDFMLFLKPNLERFPMSRSYRKYTAGLSKSLNRTFTNFVGLNRVPKSVYTEYKRLFDKDLSDYKRALDFDRKVYLVEDILKIQDLSLMSHSIEARSPYLDKEFIAFWKGIDDDELLKKKKWIHQLLLKYDLEEISKRGKMGFGLPLLEWFKEEGEFAKRAFDSIRKLDMEVQRYLSKRVKKICAKPEDYVKSDFLLLYNLFLLSDWLKQHRL